MYYKLNPDIALRRWKYVPYAYYKKGVREAQKLNKEQFDTLIQCDGLTELPDTPLVHQLIQQNFAQSAHTINCNRIKIILFKVLYDRISLLFSRKPMLH